MLMPSLETRELSLLLALFCPLQVQGMLSCLSMDSYNLGVFLCKKFLGVFKTEEPKTDMEQNEKPGMILQSAFEANVEIMTLKSLAS